MWGSAWHVRTVFVVCGTPSGDNMLRRYLPHLIAQSAPAYFRIREAYLRGHIETYPMKAYPMEIFPSINTYVTALRLRMRHFLRGAFDATGNTIAYLPCGRGSKELMVKKHTMTPDPAQIAMHLACSFSRLFAS